jgi:Holliday junction resolvasome RuvABC endonuclease subunit
MILGIDISSSITGYTILDGEGKIIVSNCIRLEKYKDFFEKAKKCKEVFEEIKNKYQIKKIFIEEPLLSFKMGFSSASTISTLSRFNGVLSWICFETFKIFFTAHFVSIIRKNFQLILKKINGSVGFATLQVKLSLIL